MLLLPSLLPDSQVWLGLQSQEIKMERLQRLGAPALLAARLFCVCCSCKQNFSEPFSLRIILGRSKINRKIHRGGLQNAAVCWSQWGHKCWSVLYYYTIIVVVIFGAPCFWKILHRSQNWVLCFLVPPLRWSWCPWGNAFCTEPGGGTFDAVCPDQEWWEGLRGKTLGAQDLEQLKKRPASSSLIHGLMGNNSPSHNPPWETSNCGKSHSMKCSGKKTPCIVYHFRIIPFPSPTFI